MPETTYYPEVFASNAITSDSTVWTTARENPGGTNITPIMYWWKTGSTYWVTEPLLSFNTSDIGEGNTVTSAVLYLAHYGVFGTEHFTIEARLHDWGPTFEWNTDWVPGSSLGDKSLLATSLTSSMASTETYHAFTDVAMPANVNKTGYTRMVLCSDKQRLDVAPASGVRVFTYAIDDVNYKPKLVVTYSATPSQPVSTYISTAIPTERTFPLPGVERTFP